jgi:purine-binding chemotaxis protein CheW
MNRVEKLLVFALSGLHCALRLPDIDRVLHAVEISSVPHAPGIVMGLINVRGRIIPVLNIRQLLHLPTAKITLNDQIILARTANFPVAILVDKTLGVAEFSEQDILAPKGVYPGIEYLEGVTRMKDGILYIYNLDRFLSLEEKSGIEFLLSGGISMPADRET